MPQNATRCHACGGPVDGAESDLAGGAWELALCASCGRRRLVADGGTALRLNEAPEDAAFDLGEVFVRPGAVHILAQSGDHYWGYLRRHAQGDTGEFKRDPARGADAPPPDNRRPFLTASGNIVSAYRTRLGHRLWIMTTPGKLTSIMAPGEF